MNHEQVQQLISGYIDNALSDRESAALFTHLGQCADCRRVLRTAGAVRSYLADVDLGTVPTSLDRRVFSSFQAARAVRPQTINANLFWFKNILMPVPVAASIAVLLIVGSLLLSPAIFSGERREETTNTEQAEQPEVPYWQQTIPLR
ncbi:MAG: zf-HC2 domain-containing protein [bacterium]